MTRPPFNLTAVEEATEKAFAAGQRLFQTHKYAGDDRAHTKLLLDTMNPRMNGLVVDAGCGVGEVSRLMAAERPDLTFALVNISEYQLSLCPRGEKFVPVLGDCHELPLLDGVADCVMFSSALCQMDIAAALKEARRVLKPGGVLMVNDMARTGGAAEEMEEVLAARVLTQEQLVAEIRAAGFFIDIASRPVYDDAHFRGLLSEAGMEHLLDGVYPILIRATATASIETVLGRHQRIALQVSGGRDSLACLFLLRPYWDQMTVYWLNTGSAFPETVQIMSEVRAAVPHFVEVQGNQPRVVEEFGLPSDLVPASHTPIGIFGGHSKGPLMQDRYSCCARVIMNPMHEQVKRDGVTLIIRGQKNKDRVKSQVRSGDVLDGIEFLFPIEDWSAEEVDAYLVRCGIKLPEFYKTMEGAPDCMTCSAWWENKAAAYLKQYHPIKFLEVQRRLNIIKDAVEPALSAFVAELSVE